MTPRVVARTARMGCAVGAAMALIAIAPHAAAAQQRLPTPRAGYVYPAGGQQGTTVQVTVGGQALNGAAYALVSGSGVHARVVKVDLPILGQALAAKRDTAQALLKQLQDRGVPDPAGRQRLLALRDTISDAARRQANPALAHLVTLEVTIAADAEPGQRVLRLQTPTGLTNPLVFCVGQLPEFLERDDKATRADAELSIALPATVNGRLVPGDIGRRAPGGRRQAGQYEPGDVDRYRFAARRGQVLVAAVSARALMPYLGDAVPGWAQTTLTLYDASGHELAYNDDWRFNPDPVLHVVVPDDGEYVLEIKDALYRGRDDFVYRIAIGELPFVTDVFPLGGRAGGRTELTLAGWNLAATRGAIEAAAATPGVHVVGSAAGAIVSNRVPFSVDTFPTVAAQPGAATAGSAQSVNLPVIIDGRIDRPGVRPSFAFTGRAGDVVVGDVTARRLGSPLDAVLEVVDSDGHRVAWNDDHEDRGAGLETHHADSWLMATLPRAGTYVVRLGDVQGRGGVEYAYRLRLSAPRPDFELRVSPSSLNVSAGNSVPVTVTAIRRDGFGGDITVSLTGAPDGFTVAGGTIPAGQDKVRMTLTAPMVTLQGATRGGGLQTMLFDPIAVGFTGQAMINGTAVSHRAVAADDVMQAFAYRALVVSDATWVAVLGRGATRGAARIVSALPLHIPAGGTVQVRAAVPPAFAIFDHVDVTLSEPPDGITVADVTAGANGLSFTVRGDAAKLKPGQRGNLIIEVSGERPDAPNAANARNATPRPAAQRRAILGMLPAIPYEIVK